MTAKYERSTNTHRAAGLAGVRDRAWDDPTWQSGEYAGPVPRKLLSPLYAPHQRALCICAGCSPFALEDGIRTRAPVLGSESTAFVGQARKRRTIVTKLVEAETHKEAVMAEKTCGNCGEKGHNARSCEAPKLGKDKPTSRKRQAASTVNGADPLVATIDDRIAELKSKLSALEKAKAALVE